MLYLKTPVVVLILGVLLSSTSSAWQIQRTLSPFKLQRPSSNVVLRASLSPRDSSSSGISSSSSTTLSSWDIAANSATSRRSTTSLASTIPHDAPIVENLHDIAEHEAHPTQGLAAWADGLLKTYWGPRGLLLVLAAVYATNFPLGALLNDHLPASAATASRMFVAGLALAPFIPRLRADLRLPAVLCGCFTAMGYVTQSLALMDVDPARVSFLGSATVLWCPFLEGILEKKPMGLRDAPQTWLAAFLCMAGIGVLELSDATAPAAVATTSAMSLSVSWGDGLALLQAVGFGTGVWWTSKMLRNDSSQALPVTATLIATTAFVSMLWCFADGWMNGSVDPTWFHCTLPGMFLDETMRPVLGAVLWTGLISTSLNFFIELTALGHVQPSEASVLLASEPLWAALFAAAFYGSHLSISDGAGGLLIVAACLVNALIKPEMLFPPKNTLLAATTTASNGDAITVQKESNQ